MSEWVTGQPAVSGYFLKLFFFYPLSLLLIAYSAIFLIFLPAACLPAGSVQKLQRLRSRRVGMPRPPQLTVSCLVEERGAAVERAPLRAA